MWIKYLVTNTYKYFSSFNEQINGKYNKKHREIREQKKRESSDSLGPCSIFLTNHSSYNYSVCHKLLNMQNIYTLPSMEIWNLLITHYVSSLHINYYSLSSDTSYSPSLLLPQERQRYMKWKDNLNSRTVRVVTFCILFNLYANSHNTTKLIYMANSMALLLVSHDAWS